MKMRRDETVYDRMQKNGGFVAGPDHKIVESREPGGSEEQKGPPNLRDALAESTICGTCSDFEGMGCKKYGVPVKFHEGCDDHSDLREEGEEEDGEEEESSMPEKEVEE